jgi:hypothetical protein
VPRRGGFVIGAPQKKSRAAMHPHAAERPRRRSPRFCRLGQVREGTARPVASPGRTAAIRAIRSNASDPTRPASGVTESVCENPRTASAGCHGRLVRPCFFGVSPPPHWQTSCQWHPFSYTPSVVLPERGEHRIRPSCCARNHRETYDTFGPVEGRIQKIAAPPAPMRNSECRVPRSNPRLPHSVLGAGDATLSR